MAACKKSGVNERTQLTALSSSGCHPGGWGRESISTICLVMRHRPSISVVYDS
jgi:hypothetical protein